MLQTPKPRLLLTSALAAAVVFCSTGSSARVEATPGYTKRQTYSAALRYLRVDLGYEVVEKDPEAAYLIFRYAPPGRRKLTQGSIEIIETRDQAKILVQLPEMPQYHEAMLRDGLVGKLRRDYGQPPRRRRSEPDEKRKTGDQRQQDRSKNDPPAERQPDATED